MKRFLTFFLALILLFPLCPVKGAIRGDMALKGEILNPKKGERFTVTLTMSQNPGIVSLRAVVTFDPKVLEAVEVEGIGPLPGFDFDLSENEILLRWKKGAQGREITATGDLAKITFRVVDDPIYGDSAIDLTVSQKLYDAQNSDGASVPFDTRGLAFTLFCPHEKQTRTVVTEPTFETEGKATLTCQRCGKSEEEAILPTLTSEDGKTVATLTAGEYKNDEIKSVFTQYLTEGEDWDAAQNIFGDDILHVFRLGFTRGDGPFYPAGKTSISLTADLSDENLALYVLLDGGAEQIEFLREENTLTFPYHESAFVLLNRKEPEEPEIPETTTSTTTKAPETSTRDTREEERQREVLLIISGSVFLILCLAGMIVLLGRRKKY